MFINEEKRLIQSIQEENVQIWNAIDDYNSKFIDFNCIDSPGLIKDECRNFIIIDSNGNIFKLDLL